MDEKHSPFEEVIEVLQYNTYIILEPTIEKKCYYCSLKNSKEKSFFFYMLLKPNRELKSNEVNIWFNICDVCLNNLKEFIIENRYKYDFQCEKEIIEHINYCNG